MRDFCDRLAYLTDPRTFAVNRLPAHAPLEQGEAIALDGKWEFMEYPCPEALDEALLCSGALPRTVDVPGHLQLQGFCGAPQYVNTQYPWDGREALLPPQLPRENPTGLYARAFTLPETLYGRTLRLCFDGAEPCVFVYLNGAFVGYAEDSFTPSEFDVTAFVRPGENRLCAVVPRFCAGNWLEDQDFWRFSGLFRQVTLRALPETYLEDVELTATLSDDFSTGTLRVSARVIAGAPARAVAALSIPGAEETARIALLPGENALSLSLPVPAPRLWTAETPHLYGACLCLRAENGAILCEAMLRAGFRRLTADGGRVLLNGKRLLLNGANRHEWSCARGRAITRAEILSDVLTLKRNSFNAVRTSHYPNQSYFYDLCDEYGLYVIDETNLETHGTWQARGESAHTERALPGDDPAWRAAALDRARSLLERDKNHPCVLFWSCGNESYGGSTLNDMAAYFRARDPGRLVHYEGIFHDRRFPATSDVESQMYTAPDALAAFLAAHPDRPVLLCEYAHAMGNSFGNVDEYAALAGRYPNYLGGFVWDLLDQCFLPPAQCANAQAAGEPADSGDAYRDYRLPDGTFPDWRVGGAYADRPHDEYFCGDGLLFADRTPSPKLREAKFLNQPFALDCRADGIAVTNRQTFAGADAYRFRWTLCEDGAARAEGSFRLDVPAGETRFLPLSLPLDCYAGELTLTCAATLRAPAPYAPAGYEAAFGQSVLRASLRAPVQAAPARLIEGDANYGARSDGALALLSRVTGLLYALRYGTELLASPVRPLFWRAPTDNDLANGFALREARWKLASLYQRATALDARADDCSVRVRYAAAGDVAFSAEYRFFADGSLTIALILPPTPGEPPCFGLELTLPRAFSRIRWYGNAAHCAASDRRNARLLRECESDVQAEYVPYPRPQTNAVKTDVRSMTLCDGDGRGLRVTSDAPFAFSALPWTCHELEAARSAAQLPPPDKTVLSLFGATRGVGGDDTWGADVHRPYRVDASRGLCCAFHIAPAAEGSERTR